MATSTSTTNALHMRSQVRPIQLSKDLRDLVEIERLSFLEPWDGRVFNHLLKRRKDIGGLAILYRKQVVGFLLFAMYRKAASLINLAVHPDYRRFGLARKLIDVMCQKLRTECDVRRVVAPVRETNLPAQLFLKAIGFEARLLPAYYEDTQEDAYEFDRYLAYPEQCVDRPEETGHEETCP